MAHCSVILLFRIQLNIYKRLNQTIMQSHKGGGGGNIANFKKAGFRICNQPNTFSYLSNVPTGQFFASRGELTESLAGPKEKHN